MTQIERPDKREKAVILLSGGLDSAIAAQMILDQGIEVYALNFHSPFCTCNSKSNFNQCGAHFFAQKIGIPIKTLVKNDDYLEIVKNPRFGYGKNMNPCIDCRIHILHKAKEFMTEIGASFVITGEVVGQRPKSQNIRALKIIDNESGLKGKILRPLSAQILEPTIMEKEGIVDRNKLLNIKGRRRNFQLDLGKKMNLITQYCAGGGCRLTDKHFSKILRDYFEHNPVPSMHDMNLLKIGRHFRYYDVKIIVGRNESENNQIKRLATEKDLLIEFKNIPSPIVYVQNGNIDLNDKKLELAISYLVRYSDYVDGEAEIIYYKNGAPIPLLELSNLEYEEKYLEKWRI